MARMENISGKLVRAEKTKEVEKELGLERPQPAVMRIPKLFKSVLDKLMPKTEEEAPPSDVVPPTPTSGGSF